MAFNEYQIGLNLFSGIGISRKYFFQDIIIDRGSKYSVTAIPVFSKEEVKEVFHHLKKEKFYADAAHNSYAYRIIQDNGSIIEGKNDDGEDGAGLCILRELQREDAKNCVVFVTRYFGGVMLYNDRFKHVIESVKILFEKIKNSA